MHFTRREFMQGGVAAFTFGFAAPSFLCDLARAQSATGRSLVVLYLSGGNDALSTLVPYNDPAYYSRRPTVAVPAERVLQIGTDSGGTAHGLHPNLTGLKSIFDAGRLAIIQRTGYPNSSRSHFRGTDIWSTANPQSPQGPGWLGRYLDTLPSPVDPLLAWNTASRLPHTLQANTVGGPSIPNATNYAFASPTGASRGSTRKPRRWPSHPTCRCSSRTSPSSTRPPGRRWRRWIVWPWWPPTHRPRPIRPPGSAGRSRRSPVRWPPRSAPRSSGSRRAAMTRTPARAPKQGCSIIC